MKKNSTIFIFLILSACLLCVWVFFISPQILKINKDFNYQVDIISVDNFFDSEKNDFIGEKYSRTNFYYEVVSFEKNMVKGRVQVLRKVLQGYNVNVVQLNRIR